MPRAKKTEGTYYFYGSFLVLDENQKNEIYQIMGIEDEKQKIKKHVIQQIQAFLGSYEPAVKSIDQKPRAANYLAELIGEGYDKKTGLLKNGLRKQVYDLYDTLLHMSGNMRKEFKEQNIDIGKMVMEIFAFERACHAIEKKYTGIESRQATPKKARQIIANHLKLLYDKYNGWTDLLDDYWDEDTRTDKRCKSIEKVSLIKFIIHCFKIGNIPCPQKTSDIENLFYTDDTPPNERIFLTKS